MNKTELVQAIAENANLTKVQAKAALDATLNAVGGALKKGDKVVTIGGFHGKITEVKENTVMVSLAPNTEVEIEKSALVQNASQVGGQN